ncbi:MAG: metallophosphoesterase [Clostridia bacterium]|nr:metallophosphoesterase [Clostridia bacterium]
MKAFFSIFFATLVAVFNFFTTDGALCQLMNKGDITGYSETVKADKELPILSTDENGDFTILQFTDTHFTTGISYNDVSVIKKMESQVKEYNPDLVIVLGDMIDDGESGAFNKQFVLDKVGTMFDELEQYWAYIPGNNDGMAHGTSADVTAYLSQFEYCLCADVRDVSGGAQYSIDIENNGTVVHSLIFLDTMDYDNEDDEHIYGYVHADQVKWCENEINAKLGKYSDISMSVFIHENTPAFAEAALYGEAYQDGYSTLDEVQEKYNIPKNKPLDEVFERAGCVGLVSMGHVHPSENKCSFYNGTYYHITSQTKTMSSLVTIHTGTDNTKEMYDFVKITE